MPSDSCGSAVAIDVTDVAPLFPGIGERWSGGIASEEESNDASEDGLVVALGEVLVLSDAFEGKDPPDRLDNKPEIRQRRRTFHIV